MIYDENTKCTVILLCNGLTLFSHMKSGEILWITKSLIRNSDQRIDTTKKMLRNKGLLTKAWVNTWDLVLL